MTIFTYEGTMDGHPVTGRVANGEITGNPFVAVRVERLVANKVIVGLGPWSGEATLDDDVLARATVAAVVEDPRFSPAVAVTGGDPKDTVY